MFGLDERIRRFDELHKSTLVDTVEICIIQVSHRDKHMHRLPIAKSFEKWKWERLRMTAEKLHKAAVTRIRWLQGIYDRVSVGHVINNVTNTHVNNGGVLFLV